MIYPRPSNEWLNNFREETRELARKPTAIPVILVNPPKPKAAPKPLKPLRAPISQDLAEQRGYGALPTMYGSAERWMLENVVADMERGGIDYQLIGRVDQFGNYLVEVWRRGIARCPRVESMRMRRAVQEGPSLA